MATVDSIPGEAQQGFKAIIVGGGPNGLYMAHALAAANIDFVVLEQQPSVIRHQGALIMLWPQSARLMDQLGMYDELKAKCIPMHSKVDMKQDGSVLVDYRLWEILEQSSGYSTLALARSELLQTLYRHLPKKETRIRCNSEVLDITEDNAGVQVHLADGHVESGSIVIGADGAHSKVREIMEAKKRSETQGESSSSSSNGNDTMKAVYYGIYAKAPNTHSIPTGIFYETHGNNKVTQLAASTTTLHYVLYKTIPGGPTSERRRYSRQQMESFATEFFDIAPCPGGKVKIADIWPSTDKETARLVNQEEGYVESWYHNRTVLVGDAACKTTSVNGLGVNCGLHSAAILASELQKLLVISNKTTTTTDEKKKNSPSLSSSSTATSTTKSAANPTTADLTSTFALYQRFRRKETRQIYQRGYDGIRQKTWATWWSWFVDLFVTPWFFNMDSVTRKYIVPFMSQGQILSYVPFAQHPGTVTWRREVETPSML